MKVYRCRICGEVYIGKEKPNSCPFCGAHENYFVLAKEWALLRSETLSDITRENLEKALDLEINNTNFYKAASEKSRDVHFSSMFKGLSKVEREHASAICKHLGIEKPDSTAGLERATEEEIKEFFKALMEIESDHIALTD